MRRIKSGSSAVRRSSRLLNCLARLRRDRRGALAPIAAIVGLGLVLAATSAVDIGRAARLRSLLQDDADNAALAGAAQATSDAATKSAQAYVAAATANLTGAPTVTPTYNYDASNQAAPVMNVTLSATMPTTLTAWVVPQIPITVSAKASGVIKKKITISLTNYSSDAADTNAIYAFGYDPGSYPDGSASLYKFAPTSGADGWTCAFINKTDSKQPSCQVPSANQVVTIEIPFVDNLGFAFSNTTGTSANCYGLSTGSNTMYYSTRLDGSGQYHDYPAVNMNYCGYATTAANSDGSTTLDNYKPVVPGSDYSNQCQSCLQVATTSYSYNGTPCTPETSGQYQGYCRIYYNYGYGYNGYAYVNPKKTTTYSAPGGSTWNYAMTAKTAYVYPQTSSRNPLTLCSGDGTSSTCTAPSSTQTCDGSSITYRWDDNGGGSDSGITSKTSSGDDDDHNDMDFTVTCTKVVGQAGAKLVG
jgi:Flp pilus assembly protein TadG